VLGMMSSLLLLAPAAQGAGAGLLDPTFGNGGFTILNEPADGNEQLKDLVIQPDGKILAGGTKSGESKGFLLARFNPNGSPDLGFGIGGFSVLPDTGPGNVGAPRGIADIEARPDGKVVALGLGRGVADVNAFLFARFTPEGVIDPTWGKSGFRLVSLISFAIPKALALAPDGKIVGVGERPETALVVKVAEDGKKGDETFGPVGIREIDVPGTTSEDGEAVKVLADGTVLVGGSAGSLGSLLAELDVNGEPVAGFGSGGIITHDLGLGPLPTGNIEDLAILADGRIVAAGGATAGPGGNRELVVARFMPDGKLDPTFAAGGIFRSDPTPGNDTAGALEVQPDGKIVVAGLRGEEMMDTVGDTWLLRLTESGQLDPTFGTGGETVASASPQKDQANGLALQADGRPVIAGYADGAGHELLVGRFTADGPVEPISKPKSGKCAGRKATLVGTAKADRLTGTKKADVIVGLKGKDTIRGRGGNDLICAGAGNDKVNGGAGKDRLLGGAGKDRLLGGAGPDLCVGGAGKDSAAGSCEQLKRVP
jgi:uncharacterized delta-60 repeat protein